MFITYILQNKNHRLKHINQLNMFIISMIMDIDIVILIVTDVIFF